MKTLLIVATLNMNLVYDNPDLCEQAREKIFEQDKSAICIPYGHPVKDPDKLYIQDFFKMLEKLMEAELDNKTAK